MALSEAISGSPDASDFTVKVAGSNATISAVAISGSDVTLTLANYILNDQSIYLTYTQNSSNSKKIVDVASTPLPSISETAVGLTNDTAVPTVVSATTSKADGVYKAGDTVNVDVLFSEAYS